jgi:hypothetical protein
MPRRAAMQQRDQERAGMKKPPEGGLSNLAEGWD